MSKKQIRQKSWRNGTCDPLAKPCKNLVNPCKKIRDPLAKLCDTLAKLFDSLARLFDPLQNYVIPCKTMCSVESPYKTLCYLGFTALAKLWDPLA